MEARIEKSPRQQTRPLADRRSTARTWQRPCASRPIPMRRWSTVITIWISNIMYDCGDSDAPEFEDRAR